MSLLSARDLAVHIGGKPVVLGVSLDFRPGEVVAIVGPNGAGKSTFLSAVAGLRRPDKGAALLDGADLQRMNGQARARRIAFMPQSQEVAWAVEVRTLVALGRTPFLGARGLTRADEAIVEAAMAQAGVSQFAGRLVTSLSGGERARVLIARALAGEPEWLLTDEPLAGLDPGHQLDAAQLFRGMAARGCGVIVTLHDLTLAARMADRIVVLNEGAVIADGSAAEALTPRVLASAYQIDARLIDGAGGALIEVVGRHG